MLMNDQKTLLAELDESTPSSERNLLAVAPATKQLASPSYTEKPFTLLQAAPDVAALADSADQKALDNFLCVYRSMKEETAKHAKSWSTPIIMFLVAYAFVFVLTVVKVIRDMVVSGVVAVRLEVIYVFLALLYIILNLTPVRIIEASCARPNTLTLTSCPFPPLLSCSDYQHQLHLAQAAGQARSESFEVERARPTHSLCLFYRVPTYVPCAGPHLHLEQGVCVDGHSCGATPSKCCRERSDWPRVWRSPLQAH